MPDGQPPTENDLMTVREVAQQLRVNETTVRRWITDGVLAAVVLPKRGKRPAYRVRRSTLTRLVDPLQETLAS